MQTQLESILTKKYLFASVLGIALLNIGVNLASKDLAILAGNLAQPEVIHPRTHTVVC